MAKRGGVTHRAEPPKKPKGIKKDKITLKRLVLIIQPDGILLNGLI